MLSLAILALVITNVVLAQTSTVSLMPLVQGDGLQGEVIGTGSDGTTYLLAGTFPSLSIPFTGALVQDATHVSEVAVIATGGVSIVVHAECDISGSEASCVETLVEPSATSALILTGPASLTPVPIVSALPTNATSSQGTITSIGSSTSELPQYLTSQPSPARPTDDSSASRNAVVGLTMVIPVLLLGLFSL